MPTYSYACDACGASFEVEQRISAEPLKVCVKCGAPKAKRQIVSGNFILKGGGWYSDGYGSSSKGDK
jgi:putative FmdB family regulatory protein